MMRRMMRRRTRAIEEKTDLKVGELEILMRMALCGLDTAGEIAKEAGVSRSLVSRSVEELVHRGYLTAEPDGEDRRIVRLTQTERARALLSSFEALREEFFSVMMEGISPEEQEVFLRVMRRMWVNMTRFAEGGEKPIRKDG